MELFLQFAQAHEREIIETIRTMVECESPSDDAAAVNRQVELICDLLSAEARLTRKKAAPYGDHLLIEFHLPGPKRKDGQILALGHTDTVYPLGTLRTMRFRESEGRLWGPGVLDMKGGIVFFIWAMRAIREAGRPVKRRVILQLNSDEEVGSLSSRPLTEKTAAKSDFVLVLEPGTGLTGKLKTARKGVGVYRVKVNGVGAHAGVDFQNGANAIVELARQTQTISSFTDLSKGLTVNPGVIRGGSRTNVVPNEADLDVDIRVARLRDAVALDRKFKSLKTLDKRCRVEITGGLNRPPMERTSEIARLFAVAKTLAAEIDVHIEESSTGGGSDGNFTAGIGIPTLDGLGSVGEGAHASHESILISRIADRVALLAGLVAKSA